MTCGWSAKLHCSRNTFRPVPNVDYLILGTRFFVLGSAQIKSPFFFFTRSNKNRMYIRCMPRITSFRSLRSATSTLAYPTVVQCSCSSTWRIAERDEIQFGLCFVTHWTIVVRFACHNKICRITQFLNNLCGYSLLFSKRTIKTYANLS